MVSEREAIGLVILATIVVMLAIYLVYNYYSPSNQAQPPITKPIKQHIRTLIFIPKESLKVVNK